MVMEHRFSSGDLKLASHLARPPSRSGGRTPGVVLCHGFPSGVGGAATAANTFPQLADRIANELGWVALAFTFRGAGQSEGQFSLGGWLDDLTAAVEHLREAEQPGGVWVAGFGAGGALGICAAARNRDIEGTAALGSPAGFEDWASQPRRLLDHAREISLITDPRFPASFDVWARELGDVRPANCATSLSPRPLLVVHSADDEVVPDLDARVVADAHGSAELRLIAGGGHRLRHDPRAVAILLGWLDRQRHQPR
jgi:pimeloyl-ACP methyl ester carboxylesterase